MNSRVKAVLISAVLIAAIALYWHYRQPSPAPPKSEPTYTVMGKKFSDTSEKIEYDLLGGEGGEIIAECSDPRSDGTGCEKFKTMQSYVFDKDASGRFLVERTIGATTVKSAANASGRIGITEPEKVHLRIKSEGFRTDKNDKDSGESDSQ